MEKQKLSAAEFRADMEETKLSVAGYRAAYEYYDRLESTYKQMAKEMNQEKMKVLAEWKQANKLREAEDL